MSAAQRRRQAAETPQQPGAAEAAAIQPAPATAVAAASPAPRAAATVSARQPLVYSYVGKEMRRILILSGVIIASIVVLSFFLN